MAVAALPSAPALPKRRSAILEFCRQQPLGAASFVVIFVMMFAGIFVLSALGIVLFLAVVALERLCLSWQSAIEGTPQTM